MNVPPFFWVIIVIVIISTVVGAVAKFLNNLNELNAPKNRPAPRADDGAGRGAGGAAPRGGNSDMDRFLAEIDRLRKKNAESPPAAAQPAPVASAVQPERPAEKPRPRVVAEPVDNRPDPGFGPPLPALPTGPKVGDLPMASVVTPPSGTGAPATRVTKIVGRARAAAKTDFAKNLTSLLNSGQGLALAIVLQEILGPPKCKTNSDGPKPHGGPTG